MSTQSAKRACIIGMDGFPFSILARIMEKGAFPAISKITGAGSSGPLWSTIPPSTIPAWAAMMTSKNPGKLGFSQFVVRTEDGYRWEFPTLNWEEWNPIWNMLSRHKKRVCMLNVPTTRAPRSDFNGAFVSGMFMSDESDFSVYPADLSQWLLGQGYRIHIPEFDPRKPRQFIENLLENIRIKNRVALEMYSRERWDLFTFVYFYTDPLFHFFWKYFDKSHSHYEKHDEIEEGIFSVLREIDNFFSALLEKMTPDAHLIVVSDHGMGPLRSYVDINAFLHEKDFIALCHEGTRKVTLEKIRNSGWFYPVRSIYQRTKHISLIRRLREFVWQKLPQTDRSWKDVDWERTRAFHLGWFGLFLNIRGRESRGCVDPAHYDTVRDEVIRALLHWQDPDHGEKIVANVYKREEIYKGPFLDRLPDLIVEFQGWNSYCNSNVEAAPGQNVFVPFNYRKHNAEHTRQGLFIAFGPDVKQSGHVENCSIYDVYPTVLHLLGMPVPDDLDGKVFKSIFREDSESYRREVTYVEGGQYKTTGAGGEGLEEKMQDRLRSLGYL